MSDARRPPDPSRPRDAGVPGNTTTPVGAAMPLQPDDPAYAGQRHYTPGFLRIYDFLVLGAFASLVWRCPTRRLAAHYRRHLRTRHLDVGPGTGYFLARSRPPGRGPVTLVDPNPHVLRHAAARLAPLRVSRVQADVCKPLPLGERYDSAALSYVLHCLPAPAERKSAAVGNVAAVLADDGVLFGATVLGDDAPHTPLSRAALRANNRRGIFDNLDDTESWLHDVLVRWFETSHVEVVGSVGVFAAARPRRP